MQERNLQLAASLLTFLTINASAAVLYVDVNSTNATPPYTGWSTAATNIQDAVDAAVDGDQILVTNGVYQTGGYVVYGSMTNRVAVTKPVTVQSVNGPAVTVIQGYQVAGTTNGDSAIRCAYLTNGSTLVGFTLTNGATRSSGDLYQEQSGGGVFCQSVSAVVSNCQLVLNSAKQFGGGAYSGNIKDCLIAQNSAYTGGGVSVGRQTNCVLRGNSAANYGGGADHGVLINCILLLNHAYIGGGASFGSLSGCLVFSNSASFLGGGLFNPSPSLVNCTIVFNSANQYGGISTSGAFYYNSIIYYNSAASNPNYSGPNLRYCCTTPLAPGEGNITNEPVFMEQVGGNFRLATNSPCINSGKNSSAPIGTDLDSNPRIAGGNVDIGAYEFQGTGLSEFTGWLWQFGLRTDGSADYTDSDGDRLNNWQEWIAGTVPTNSLSVLQLLNPTNEVAGVKVTWQSVTNRTYWLERAIDLGTLPPFSLLQSNLTGQAATTSYTDTNVIGDGPFFYRVGVQQ